MHAHLSRTGLGDWASVAFVDLNGFKDINDRYGHDIGDEVLIEVARRLRTVASGRDVIARIGATSSSSFVPARCCAIRQACPWDPRWRAIHEDGTPGRARRIRRWSRCAGGSTDRPAGRSRGSGRRGRVRGSHRPVADEADAQTIADRIHHAIGGQYVLGLPDGLAQASIGVAVSGPDDTPSSLMQRAVDALYATKETRAYPHAARSSSHA